MSKRKKTVVQPAAESKPSPDRAEAAPSEPSQEAPIAPMPFDLSKVDPKKVELAEEMGIPIKQLIGWASSVEQRFTIIQQNLAEAPQKVVEALKAEAHKRQTEMAQQMQRGGETQQGGGVGLRDVIALAKEAGITGGSNPLQDKMMESMFEKTMMGMDLSNALTKAMIIKLAPELASELTKTLVAKSG